MLNQYKSSSIKNSLLCKAKHQPKTALFYIKNRMHWNVIEVEAISPLSIRVIFSDGTTGKVQFKPSHLTGVFEKLKDPEIFRQAYIENGAVTWPGNADLAPDAMYQAIKNHEEWILN